LGLLEFGEFLLGLEMARRPPILDPELGPELEKVVSDWLIKYVPLDLLEDAAAQHPMAVLARQRQQEIDLER